MEEWVKRVKNMWVIARFTEHQVWLSSTVSLPFLFGSLPPTHCSRSVYRGWRWPRTPSPSSESAVIAPPGSRPPWCASLSPSRPGATREGCCSGAKMEKETFLDIYLFHLSAYWPTTASYLLSPNQNYVMQKNMIMKNYYREIQNSQVQPIKSIDGNVTKQAQINPSFLVKQQ